MMVASPSKSPPAKLQPRQHLVRFRPFRSVAEPSFWLDHNARKLNELRLSEESVPLAGFFGVSAPSQGVTPPLSPGMRFDASSSSSPYNDSLSRRNEYIRSSGKIISLNTIESLKKCDKNKFLNDTCLPTLLACCGVLNIGDDDENTVEMDPNVSLIPCTCLTYCDLKSNMTVYWFAFPALAPRTGCGIAYSTVVSNPQRKLINDWSPRECRLLAKSIHKFRMLQECRGTNKDHVWCPPFFILIPSATDGENEKSMKCLPFSQTVYDSLSQVEKELVIFGFVDPNPTPENDDDATTTALGWTLRNFVAYISLRLKLGGRNATFLSYRPPFLRRIDHSETATVHESSEDFNSAFESFSEDCGINDDDGGIGQSLLVDIKIPLAEDYQWLTPSESSINCYKCVGWELNKNNKPGPRSIDLRPLVSPTHLARQANDLNLRLMKWRALPSLDVEVLSRLKVLLLGAGTLGCGVARTLLGWGVRHITFVDSGRVSYSNPVRQSLFGIDDCKDGGKYKAVAAAESLVSVAGPDVKSEGVVLSIPMPGHSFGGGKDGATEVAAVKKEVERLHALVEEHDAVFLLTDTRESRWLPTVMALATNTPLINAALGLDSWLVMRHGPNSSALSAANNNSTDFGRLGCYFCSDIVAPENSTRDRTLDQQCTVTRPGLAPIAASMATELMVAMFHHPLGNCAPAPEIKRDGSSTGAYNPVDDGTSASSSALGLLPHQIRGTVVTYTMMTPTVPAFPSCTACSEGIVEEYRKGGFDFVKAVCCDVDGSYLENVSGLSGFREEAAKMMDECLDWDDEEEDV